VTYKVFSDTILTANGQMMSRRFLITEDEAQAMREHGIVAADFCEVVGMQTMANQIAAGFESEAYRATGGILQ
jgi:hypothetical protein